MNKTNVTKFFNDAKALVSKRSPEILTGLGIAGMITTTVLAVKATPKAMRIIEEAKQEQQKDKLTPFETVQAVWKPYIPAVVTGTVSVACLVGASSVNLKRNAALAAAYNLSATALSEYKDKVVETIGEKKEQAIRDKIAQDKLNKAPSTEPTSIIITGNGKQMCYDPLTGTKFESSVEKIQEAINSINAMLLDNDFVSLNDFYYELGIPQSKVGHDMGWNTSLGKRASLIRVHFSSELISGTPFIVLEYDVAPKYDYDKFFV